MDLEPPDDATIQKLFDTPGDVTPGAFKIALVLGGTVSSGAYTAGVLDFLVEALDTWTTPRDAGAAVPHHRVALRLTAGTSGGGVNAAIFTRAMNYDFTRFRQATPAATAQQIRSMTCGSTI